MDNFKTTLLLDKIPGATITVSADGKKGVFIPFDENDVFVSDAGHAYLRLSHWLNRMGPDQRGNTHTVKVGLGKEFAAAHPELAGKNAPIIGNTAPMTRQMPQAPYSMPQAPQGYQQPPYGAYPPPQGYQFPQPQKPAGGAPWD